VLKQLSMVCLSYTETVHTLTIKHKPLYYELMHKVENIKDLNTSQVLTQYVDKVRRAPSVRSFFWLLRCADALNKYAEMEVGQNGDNRIGIAVLQIVLKHPDGVSQQEIARQTGRTKQAIVVAIDNLEKKGRVIRCSNSIDRRINSIRITKEGVNHLSEVFPHTMAMCDEALSSLNAMEVEQLLSLVKKLTKDMWQKIESQSPENGES
jgi:DNA-binding MarR family transcriptional regulator